MKFLNRLFGPADSTPKLTTSEAKKFFSEIEYAMKSKLCAEIKLGVNFPTVNYTLSGDDFFRFKPCLKRSFLSEYSDDFTDIEVKLNDDHAVLTYSFSLFKLQYLRLAFKRDSIVQEIAQITDHIKLDPFVYKQYAEALSDDLILVHLTDLVRRYSRSLDIMLEEETRLAQQLRILSIAKKHEVVTK